jgi:hypothetical protein
MTVTLLWKCNELIVTQQELLRYYSNATKGLTCHNIYLQIRNNIHNSKSNDPLVQVCCNLNATVERNPISKRNTAGCNTGNLTDSNTLWWVPDYVGDNISRVLKYKSMIRNIPSARWNTVCTHGWADEDFVTIGLCICDLFQQEIRYIKESSTFFFSKTEWKKTRQ